MKRALYKNKYFITFYENDNDTLFMIFDNVIEILQYLQKEVNDYNRRLIDIELYRALKQRNGKTQMLGRTMYVYIFDENEDDDINESLDK